MARDAPAEGAFARPSWVAVERAAGELRRGLPVLLTGAGETACLVAAAETLSEAILAEIEAAAGAPADVLLTAERARTLKIRLYTGAVVALPR
ncbi:MAG: hypothetical protein H6923_07415, partial [Alphaproteobacteria bacterium]|nr:hypothetical protein [Alphaproteobacteria bacterium]